VTRAATATAPDPGDLAQAPGTGASAVGEGDIRPDQARALATGHPGAQREAAHQEKPAATLGAGIVDHVWFGLAALVGEPVLIVLDEAFNGLDSASALILKRHLRKRADNNRCAIVLATHALDVVERCADRMILLDEGRGIGSWDRAALDALRSSGTQNCLEMTLADTICSVRARDAQGE